MHHLHYCNTDNVFCPFINFFCVGGANEENKLQSMAAGALGAKEMMVAKYTAADRDFHFPPHSHTLFLDTLNLLIPHLLLFGIILF